MIAHDGRTNDLRDRDTERLYGDQSLLHLGACPQVPIRAAQKSQPDSTFLIRPATEPVSAQLPDETLPFHLKKLSNVYTVSDPHRVVSQQIAHL